MANANSNFASTSCLLIAEELPNQNVDERQPLLAQTGSEGSVGDGAGKKKKVKKPFYRARPLWLVPFALVTAVVRGMTLAPRVEVFTQLSCHRIYRTHHLDGHVPAAVFGFQKGANLEDPSSSLEPSITTGTPGVTRINNAHLTTLYSYAAEAEPVFYPTFVGGIFDGGDDDDDKPDPNDSTSDPRNIPSHRCVEDPDVTSGAAKLQMIMTTTMGLLSALTTGWWGCFGERHGRTRVLAVSTFGLFLTDLMFILVSTPSSALSKHGHKLLLIAPAIEGALGGWSTLQAATSAYISDCTSSGSRAHIFSRFSGVTFLGIFFGPSISGYLISRSAGTGVGGTKNVTMVFWVAVFFSFVNFLAATFVLPESLTQERREAALKVQESSKKGKAPMRGRSGREEDGDVKQKSNFLSTFFGPLAVFLPVRMRDPVKLNRYRTDWSLTLIAVSFFCSLLCVGLYQLKYLYAEHVYGWGAEQLSWYISYLGGMRAISLLVVLPYLIGVLKPKAIDSTSSSQKGKGKGKASAGTVPASSSIGGAQEGAKPKPTYKQLRGEIAFDLMFARCSFLMDMVSNLLIVVSPAPTFRHTLIGERNPAGTSVGRSQALFVLASGMASFGNGTVPAVQSLTLCILQAREMSNSVEGRVGGETAEEGESSAETGKGGSGNVGGLFGAFAFLQAIGSMILGPIMFGMIYSSTVAVMPKAIFMVAAATLCVSLVLMMLVRNPVHEKTGPGLGKKGKKKKRDVERGRSRVSKDLRGGAAGYIEDRVV